MSSAWFFLFFQPAAGHDLTGYRKPLHLVKFRFDRVINYGGFLLQLFREPGPCIPCLENTAIGQRQQILPHQPADFARIFPRRVVAHRDHRFDGQAAGGHHGAEIGFRHKSQHQIRLFAAADPAQLGDAPHIALQPGLVQRLFLQQQAVHPGVERILAISAEGGYQRGIHSGLHQRPGQIDHHTLGPAAIDGIDVQQNFMHRNVPRIFCSIRVQFIGLPFRIVHSKIPAGFAPHR